MPALLPPSLYTQLAFVSFSSSFFSISLLKLRVLLNWPGQSIQRVCNVLSGHRFPFARPCFFPLYHFFPPPAVVPLFEHPLYAHEGICSFKLTSDRACRIPTRVATAASSHLYAPLPNLVFLSLSYLLLPVPVMHSPRLAESRPSRATHVYAGAPPFSLCPRAISRKATTFTHPSYCPLPQVKLTVI